ncbi:hypothetical protein HYH03_006229 [Edaphochlamys debaryana]|uniref:Uncharacterized protein n=1 Tax=Edaphochlamys debaryana TaxID=47281 RepID=A0A835Y5P9_9CHLO|nr:hypothetical protein HYH03_006229 [Edaphochlamys debaryana]|eukprot:KAG2495629.1 hypothetical protein HYH03_006229 [Edaphochlamys debaryana]
MPPRGRPARGQQGPNRRATGSDEDWKALLELGRRLLPGKGPRLGSEDLSDLQRRLDRLQAWVRARASANDDEAVASAISARHPALLPLVAWATHLHPDPSLSPDMNALQQAVALGAGSLVEQMLRAATPSDTASTDDDEPPSSSASVAPPEPPAVAFCRQLLHMQPLRAAAVQLSARLKALEAAVAVDGASASSSAGGRRPPTAQAVELLSRAAADSVMPMKLSMMLTDAMAFVADSQAALTPLFREFVAELEASHVMEHGARLLMQQARAMERLEAVRSIGGKALRGSQERAADTASALRSCIPPFLRAYHRHLWLGPDTTTPNDSPEQAEGIVGQGRVGANGATAPVVPTGPAGHFVVLAYCVRTLCAADGGPAYGLPEAASGVPVLSAEPEGPQGKRRVFVDELLDALIAVIYAPHARRTPPLTRRAAMALALRLGRIALATARGSGARKLPAVPSPDDPRLVLGLEDWGYALTSALDNCANCQDDVAPSSSRVPLRPFRRPSWAAEAEAAWRLWVDAVRWAVPHMDWETAAQVARHGSRMMGDVAEDLWDKGMSSIPLEAPPELSAPLRAGCLPALELVIRRAGEEPAGPFSAVLSGLCTASQHLAEQLDAMLLYGEPAQGAALVASLGTVLRHLVQGPDVLAGRWRPEEDSRQAAILLAAQLLQRAPSRQDVAAAPSLAQRQSLLMCLAVAEWLPPLSLLGRRAAEQVLKTAGSAVPELQPLGAVPVCGGGGGGGAARGGGTGAGGEAGGGGGGREEVDASGDGSSSGSDSGSVVTALDWYYLCPSTVAACVLRLARLVPACELLAAAGDGPRFPWRPEALRALRAELESESKGKEAGVGIEDKKGGAGIEAKEDGGRIEGKQTGTRTEDEETGTGSEDAEDGAVCGAALEQLATGLERASSGASGGGGAEWLGVSAEELETGVRVACRLSIALSELPALQPLAEARALRPPRACANPACVSLAGDSAADAPPPRPAGLGGCCSKACAQELARRRKGR